MVSPKKNENNVPRDKTLSLGERMKTILSRDKTVSLRERMKTKCQETKLFHSEKE